MSTTQELKIFDDKHIRTFWDDKDEKWLFCINDIVAALTDSPEPAALSSRPDGVAFIELASKLSPNWGRPQFV